MSPVDGTIIGSYDHLLVALSVGIAVLASYSALDLAERVTAARGAAKQVWLMSGALAMGIGIWSMHFIGMLAFQLPVPVLYHWPTVLFSLLLGIVSSIIALFVVSRERLGILLALAASIFQGTGIAALHYISMAAMRLPAMCHYSSAIVALSVLVAIAGSLLSLWLTFLFRDQPGGHKVRKTASALLMGAAVCVMHYTAMAAGSFTESDAVPDLSHAVRITSLGVAGIVTVPLMVLVGAVVTVLVDRLRDQGAVLDAFFENAPPTVLIRADRRVIRVNPEFTRAFGYTSGEAVGRLLSDLVAPGELEMDFQKSWELVSHGQRTDIEGVCQRKDGSRMPVLVLSVPVSVRSEVVVVCAMYRDISKRKTAEIALQSLSSRLLEVHEKERRHLARELHDEIGQLLTYLRLLLKLDGDPSPDALKGQFERARGVVDDLLARVGTLSFDLRPADLDQLGLLPALLSLFERYTTQTGILVDFKHRGLERRFPPRLETGAYRVAQEALTNVVRHAGAAAVTVRIWTEGSMLNLQIEDRGCGFDLDAALKAPRSSGLLGMQERITLLGGRLTIESSPGSGTTVAAELPLDKAAAAEA